MKDEGCLEGIVLFLDISRKARVDAKMEDLGFCNAMNPMQS